MKARGKSNKIRTKKRSLDLVVNCSPQNNVESKRREVEGSSC